MAENRPQMRAAMKGGKQLISWSEIEAECGNYRDGFVSVFRRYEGQPTDEKDGQGRTVKVTAASFSRHVGIPEQTFRGWIRTTTRVVQPTARAHMNAGAVIKALNDPQTRARVLDRDDGIAAVKRASREAHVVEHEPAVEPLPRAPRVTPAFWNAVQAVRIAHEQIERYGMADLALDREAREAGEQMHRLAGEIAAAVTEATIESRMEV